MDVMYILRYNGDILERKTAQDTAVICTNFKLTLQLQSTASRPRLKRWWHALIPAQHRTVCTSCEIAERVRLSLTFHSAKLPRSMSQLTPHQFCLNAVWQMQLLTGWDDTDHHSYLLLHLLFFVYLRHDELCNIVLTLWKHQQMIAVYRLVKQHMFWVMAECPTVDKTMLIDYENETDWSLMTKVALSSDKNAEEDERNILHIQNQHSSAHFIAHHESVTSQQTVHKMSHWISNCNQSSFSTYNLGERLIEGSRGLRRRASHQKIFVGHTYKYAAFDIKPTYNH